jgi:hypothetical protein
MASVNETQRKYIRQRLTELRNQKLGEIKSMLPNALDRSRGSGARNDYLISELARVGLDWKFSKYGELETPFDVETNKILKERDKLVQNKVAELNALFNELMDKVILGEDSAELAAVLAALNDFNTGEAT